MDTDPCCTQPTLRGDTIELQPLKGMHAETLLDAAADGELWNLKVTVVPGPTTIDQYIARALAGRDNGSMMPFVIVRRDTGAVIGSTRFWKIDPINRSMEIGHTWLARSAQRTHINTECKLLLLSHAFEQMQATRVQFMTDELNTASRNAILRIGALQEGIIRHERIMPDGRIRNSVLYSVIETEWPQVKEKLQKKLARD